MLNNGLVSVWALSHFKRRWGVSCSSSVEYLNRFEIPLLLSCYLLGVIIVFFVLESLMTKPLPSASKSIFLTDCVVNNLISQSDSSPPQNVGNKLFVTRISFNLSGTYTHNLDALVLVSALVAVVLWRYFIQVGAQLWINCAGSGA